MVPQPVTGAPSEAGAVLGGAGCPAGEPGKVEQPRVQQVAGARVHEGAEHLLPASGVVGLPLVEQRLDLHALQPVLAAAQIAGDDGVVHRAGEAGAIGLGHMGQRAVDEKIALFVQQPRRI